MKIIDLAMNVNFSAIPNSKTAEKYQENSKALYDYCTKHVEELLSLSNNEGYHTGMAFIQVIAKMKDPDCGDRHSVDAVKFKFSLYSAVVCLWKGIQMGTMQSCIAADTLIHTIDQYKEQYFVQLFMRLTGSSLVEILGRNPESLKIEIENIYKNVKYYLVQITRAQDAFKDADIEKCNDGEGYLESLYEEIKNALNGYRVLGMI